MELIAETDYELTVKGNVKMVTMRDSFTTLNKVRVTQLHSGESKRWNGTRELLIEDKGSELKEYYDPNTSQIIDFVNKLAKIYERQHLLISAQGKIVKLLNHKEILARWKEVKDELMRVNPISAFEIIKHKERELYDIEAVIENLENSHFLYLFLYAYSVNGAYSDEHNFDREERDRMGIGFMIPVSGICKRESNGSDIFIKTKAERNDRKRVDEKLIKKVTGQETLEISHFSKGMFTRNPKNWLSDARMEVYEQINNDYKSDLYLNLKTVDYREYGS